MKIRQPKYFFKCPFCEKGAFLMYKKPVYSDKLMANNCIFPDGTKPVSGDNVKCFQCKTGIPDFYLRTERVFNL